MNGRNILLRAALGLLLGLHVAHPAAADTPVGTVSGSGHEVIKRPPELLRMQIELSAKGKTLTDALKSSQPAASRQSNIWPRSAAKRMPSKSATFTGMPRPAPASGRWR